MGLANCREDKMLSLSRRRIDTMELPNIVRKGLESLYEEISTNEKRTEQVMALMTQILNSQLTQKGVIRAFLVAEQNNNFNNTNKNSSSQKLIGGEDMKNIRQRADGRWEYRKMSNGKKISIIKTTQKQLLKAIQAIQKEVTYIKETKSSLFDVAVEWFELFKKGKIVSDSYYENIVYDYLSTAEFRGDIKKLEFSSLQSLINNLAKTHGPAKYCYLTLKGVLKYAYQKNLIKQDIGQFLQAPKNLVENGDWFNLEQQKLLLDNLDKTPIKYEILFYLMTGARRNEALTAKILFDRNIVYINGTKTEHSKNRWIKISEEFKQILQQHWPEMFKFKGNYYTKQFADYLEVLGIKNKSLHDLRHTFNTNLYYLGCPDKERQMYMGHASIIITNDIYTHLDPTVTKDDIFKLYNNLYPKF